MGDHAFVSSINFPEWSIVKYFEEKIYWKDQPVAIMLWKLGKFSLVFHYQQFASNFL